MTELFSLLVFAGVAVFFAIKLYGVLGRSEGHMEPPKAPEPKPKAHGAGDRLPPVRPAFEGPAAAGLEAIAQADSSFSPDGFLDGAGQAYRMIVEGFARGDKDTLRTLLADKVFDRYAAVIDERRAKGETAKTEIDRIVTTQIVDASAEDGVARMKVKFEADIASEVTGSDGQTVSGDLGQLSRVAEYWTFQRRLDTTDPNWVLASVAVA